MTASGTEVCRSAPASKLSERCLDGAPSPQVVTVPAAASTADQHRIHTKQMSPMLSFLWLSSHGCIS